MVPIATAKIAIVRENMGFCSLTSALWQFYKSEHDRIMILGTQVAVRQQTIYQYEKRGAHLVLCYSLTACNLEAEDNELGLIAKAVKSVYVLK